MGRYALIKLLLIIPSLFLLSLIVFFMSKIAPGDPIASVVELRGQISEEFNTGEISPEYKMIARELNLDQIADIARQIKKLQKEMKAAAERYEFEQAAALRDQIFELQERELELR